MATHNQLEYPPAEDQRPSRDGEVDLTKREDKDALLALAMKHMRELENLFDEKKFTVEEQSFLQKKTHLYQWENSDLVAMRGEKKARVKIIDRALEREADAKQRKELAEEKNVLLAELEDFTRQPDKEKSEKLAAEKRNRLRTNWVTWVLAEAQFAVENFSEKQLGVNYGFDELIPELKELQAKEKELLRHEARLKAALEDASGTDDPRAKLRLEVMAAELQDVYQMKKELVTVDLPRFKDRCLHLLRDLRHRLLGEKLEV